MRGKFQRQPINLDAGLTFQFDTANASVDRVFVTVDEGLMDLWVGQGSGTGGSRHFRLAASPIPYEFRLPMCAYTFSVNAADGRALEAVMVLTNG